MTERPSAKIDKGAIGFGREARPADGAGTRPLLTRTDLTRPRDRVREPAAGRHDLLDAPVAEPSGTSHTSRHDELLERYAKS